MPDHLTRREFLKTLGLLGVGAGLAPALDMGESWNDKAGEWKRPSWVSEADKPTIEIDWDEMKRFDYPNTVLVSLAKYIGEERVAELGEIRAENLKNWLEQEKPGYRLQDQALAGATGAMTFPMANFLEPEGTTTPEDRGVARWEGSPEDASKMIRAGLRYLGAASVGFVELDENTRKLIYNIDNGGKKIVFEDVDEPSEDDEKRVIPNKAKWVIIYTVQMSEETWSRSPTPLGNMTSGMGYDLKVAIQRRAQKFINGLGYRAVGEASYYNALGLKPAFGVLAGLGELSRLNRMITPEYGPVVRAHMLVTDLPLAPTKPIDAGIMEFCKRCKKCADLCPSKALSFDDEPTWEVRGPWNNPGHKAYFEDSPKCRSYWFQVGTGCGICFAVCPFASKDKALIHEIRNRLAASVPALDGTMKSLDDLLYTPAASMEDPSVPTKDPLEWWDLDLPEYGVDTMRGKNDAW